MNTSPQERRCAIYTRKSVDEGLDQELNSLTVQREAAESYIQSQRGEGWRCLPKHYDDGGFSGGNLERPALQTLLIDIDRGEIDCVVVYKVDRLSRSLLDFARLTERFEKHDVTFVSVTQQINTSTSLGRLTLGILVSFAQFEREQIAERTRDRMASARRKGKWTGGRPVLGYDVVASGGAISVNEIEARKVRQIFEIYLEERSLSHTVTRLRREGFNMKQWVTREGRNSGGGKLTKGTLHSLLTNVLYLGQVTYQGEEYLGAHPGIVDPGIFERVQHQLNENDVTGGSKIRNKHDALLRGLLRCHHCGTAMSHTFTKKKSGKLYRYYVCQTAMKESWAACPTKSVSAGDIEEFIVSKIRGIGQDTALQAEVAGAFLQKAEAKRANYEKDLTRLRTHKSRLERRIIEAAEAPEVDAQLALLDSQRDQCVAEIGCLSQTIDETALPEEDEIKHALGRFSSVWENLTTAERCEAIRLLVQQVDYDGVNESLEVTWKGEGIDGLFEQN